MVKTGLKRVDRLFLRDRRAVWGTALTLLALIVWLDYATGVEVDFDFFYLLPIFLVSWYAGTRQGMLLAALAAGVWGGADLLSRHAQGTALSGPHILLWNLTIVAASFVVVALALARLHVALKHEVEMARLKTELLSLVSHEFNNALTSMGMALLLLRVNDGAEQRAKVFGVLDRIHRVLKTTVSNFLNQARMESGRFRLDIKQIELRGVVRDTLELLQPLSLQKGQDLRLDFPEKPIPVSADPDALSLVMSNLIGNAIKYTPDKGRVTVRLRALGDPAREAEVSVEDTGIGIAAEDQEAVFRGFYRSAQGQKQAKGFGVGLKLSREILEAHESGLKVESELGKGSRFYFSLPVCSPGCPKFGAGLCHRCRQRNPEPTL